MNPFNSQITLYSILFTHPFTHQPFSEDYAFGFAAPTRTRLPVLPRHPPPYIQYSRSHVYITRPEPPKSERRRQRGKELLFSPALTLLTSTPSAHVTKEGNPIWRLSPGYLIPRHRNLALVNSVSHFFCFWSVCTSHSSFSCTPPSIHWLCPPSYQASMPLSRACVRSLSSISHTINQTMPRPFHQEDPLQNPT